MRVEPSTCGSPTRVRMTARASGSDTERAAQFIEQALPHLDKLYNGARRMTPTPFDAEDLVQETILAAYTGFANFRTGSNMRAWLFRIMYHTWVNAVPGSPAQTAGGAARPVHRLGAGGLWAARLTGIAVSRDRGAGIASRRRDRRRDGRTAAGESDGCLLRRCRRAALPRDRDLDEHPGRDGDVAAASRAAPTARTACRHGPKARAGPTGACSGPDLS